MNQARRSRGEVVKLDQTAVGRLSRMDAMQSQSMAIAEQKNAEIRLLGIEAALNRINTGTYGECASCGEQINEARLEANPLTPFCLKCASNREKHE